MKKFAIAWGLLAILLVGALTYIGFQYEESIEGYQALEQDIIEATGIYITQQKIEMKPNESKRIKANDLVKNKCLESLEVEEDKCNGYVIVKRKQSGYDYQAYIQCKDYTSVGYEE